MVSEILLPVCCPPRTDGDRKDLVPEREVVVLDVLSHGAGLAFSGLSIDIAGSQMLMFTL